MFVLRSAVGPVEVAFTDRAGGVSGPPFDSLNLAATGDDDPSAVRTNLCRVQQAFAGTSYGEPWALMHQVHGGDVVRVHAADLPAEPSRAWTTCRAQTGW